MAHDVGFDVDFEEAFRGIFGGQMETGHKAETVSPEELRTIGIRYLVPHEFKLGQLVRLKPMMRCTKSLDYNHPAVVVDIAKGNRTPIDSGGNHGFEPNDIRIGLVIGGNFECFWVDGHRFEPYAD